MSFRTASVLIGLTVLAACAPRRAPPPPVTAPPQAQQPPPSPVLPPPLPVAWVDAPLASGDWSYSADGGRPTARFGPGGSARLVVRCEAPGQVLIAHNGGQGTSMIVRTTYGDRTLPATADASGLVARLPARDALLDRMIFSRGRFAVQSQGAGLLIVPSWPEVARVTEECR